MRSLNLRRFIRLPILSILLLGCAVLAERQLNEQWGEPSVQNRLTDTLASDQMEFHRDIQPIINQRCVVCHACYDSPCQLNMSSFEGIDRGAHKQPVYDGTRLLAISPSRVSIDEPDTLAWRSRGYFPVLNEREQLAQANLQGSLLYRMLELKQQHPLPAQKVLKSFDFSASRDSYCPTIEEFDTYASNNPQGGMPFGMPALSEAEFSKVTRWLEQGAKVKPPAALPDSYQQEISKWERFFNGPSLKEQLFSRYAFEHLYLGHLYFESTGPEQYFRLVRSRTAPGEPVDEIATRRPFDEPGSEVFYYRLQPDLSTVVDKTHMPYRLNDARMAKWKEWFLEPDYAVTSLPGYEPETASNPFKTFAQLPASARYRFMLEEAEFTIMGYIKGPVCRGQVALNVIEDHFWVFFVDPDVETMLYDPAGAKKHADNLRLPAAEQSNALPFEIWTKYSKLQEQHLQNKLAFLQRKSAQGTSLSLDMIWDGEGHNPNAALTIFRHFDNATVVKGLQGRDPKTAWVISYSLLERIHYLLVAGFDVYGNVGHQLNTRLYMDFLRMEGESQFLMFMPEKDASREFLSWYQGAESEVQSYIKLLQNANIKHSNLTYVTENKKSELFGFLRQHLGPEVLRASPLVESRSPSMQRYLNELETLQGAYLAFLPELSFIRLTLEDGSQQVISMTLNRVHRNVSSLFMESSRWLPDLFYVSLYPGILGSYPNTFFDLSVAELPDFIRALKRLGAESDYRDLKDRFGIRRTDEDFWLFTDWLHDWFRKYQPEQAGIIDLNRFENR